MRRRHAGAAAALRFHKFAPGWGRFARVKEFMGLAPVLFRAHRPPRSDYLHYYVVVFESETDSAAPSARQGLAPSIKTRPVLAMVHPAHLEMFAVQDSHAPNDLFRRAAAVRAIRLSRIETHFVCLSRSLYGLYRSGGDRVVQFVAKIRQLRIVFCKAGARIATRVRFGVYASLERQERRVRVSLLQHWLSGARIGRDIPP